jgi:S-formylglutathione hydrolase FrmB
MKKLIFLFVLILSSNFILAQYPAGKVVTEYLYSASLENELGEDPTRRVTIYLPPGYNETADRYPVIYYLHGYTWNDSLQIADDRFDKLLDKAIAQGKIKPVIVVIPNHYTIYRGSWYVNSSLSGKWADFTAIDLVSHIDKNYHTIPDRNSRGITGHSMGGFGAINLGMLFPDIFSVVYALSPGGLHQPDAIIKPRVLKINTREELLARRNTWDCLYVAMGRAFSPNPDNPPFYVDLPYNLIDDSMVVNKPVLKLWRQNAPFEMAGHYIDNLKELTALKLDWGRNDEISSIPGQSLMFSQKLDSLGIMHYAEEYLGMHSDKIWTDDGRALNSMLPFFDAFLTFQ